MFLADVVVSCLVPTLKGCTPQFREAIGSALGCHGRATGLEHTWCFVYAFVALAGTSLGSAARRAA